MGRFALACIFLGEFGHDFPLPKNTSLGLVLLTDAARLGNIGAAMLLRVYHSTGKHGLPVDNDEASRWDELSEQREEVPPAEIVSYYVRNQ